MKRIGLKGGFEPSSGFAIEGVKSYRCVEMSDGKEENKKRFINNSVFVVNRV